MVASSKMYNYAGYAVGVAWLTRQVMSNTASMRKSGAGKGKAGSGANAYSTFSPDMKYLMRVCFPSWHCQESMLAFSFVLVLLARTAMSLVIADVDGYMVKQLINQDKGAIARGVVMWLAMALPSSFINSLIKYLQSRLALGLRARMTNHVRDLYFDSETYFRVSHLDKRVANPEHAMTEDIAQWADRFADLLSSLGKPLVDVVFFSAVLFQKLGFKNQFTASVVVWETGKLLKWFRPNFAELVQERGSLEANLRLKHTNVIGASEEIAFCKGDSREKAILEKAFLKIVNFTRKVLRQQIGYYTLEDFVTKYLWTVVGLIQVAVPLLKMGKSAGDNAKYFITIRRMMVRNGDATERLMVGIKDVHEFRGFTRRVMDMIRVYKDTDAACRKSCGEVTVSNDIVVEDLPIVTPARDTLIPSMNMRLDAGDRLLILGPNGCGKSSLFRILCGLWPALGGRIAKPAERTDLFFLPQRPYLMAGTFREQIIYPHTVEEMARRGVTDADLIQIMEDVLLLPVMESHGGLDAVESWTERLSGGEKQRLGLGRVMYHRPQFAILDECSSAINVEAEQFIFRKLVDLKLGLITISHRPTLFPFHKKLLTFDGEGHYAFSDRMETSALEDLSQKKTALMKDLHSVLRDLGEDWPKKFEGAVSAK